MFYEKQSKQKQEQYKNMLATIGSLSNLFAESETPMLYYRAHENCFCKYFDAENLARHDCSADAKKDRLGIGLKTWVGTNIQKVAEFGKLKNELDKLNDDELVRRVAEIRNSRIETTMNKYGLDKMIYHVVTRNDGEMKIKECSLDFISIQDVRRLVEKDGNNTRYFTDGRHIYNFNKAKTTLYMNFDYLDELDSIPVLVMEDPYRMLELIFPNVGQNMDEILKLTKVNNNRRLALKLYKDTKYGGKVESKSGLNIWNAAGRVRHPDEVYIPFNTLDRERPENANFFPPQTESFTLELPDGKKLSAKVCQQNGKAIMSNPNRDLGKWLLRDVLKLPEGKVVTYELLQEKGFDTVVFEKINDTYYKVDFTDSSVYDKLYAKSEE